MILPVRVNSADRSAAPLPVPVQTGNQGHVEVASLSSRLVDDLM
jgi:hypothetical protein